MGTVDNFVLTILCKRNENLSLAELVSKFREIELPKTPTRTAIYQRLRVLNEREMVNCEWQEGIKLYKISANGTEYISKLIECYSRI